MPDPQEIKVDTEALDKLLRSVTDSVGDNLVNRFSKMSCQSGFDTSLCVKPNQQDLSKLSPSEQKLLQDLKELQDSLVGGPEGGQKKRDTSVEEAFKQLSSEKSVSKRGEIVQLSNKSSETAPSTPVEVQEILVKYKKSLVDFKERWERKRPVALEELRTADSNVLKRYFEVPELLKDAVSANDRFVIKLDKMLQRIDGLLSEAKSTPSGTFMERYRRFSQDAEIDVKAWQTETEKARNSLSRIQWSHTFVEGSCGVMKNVVLSFMSKKSPAVGMSVGSMALISESVLKIEQLKRRESRERLTPKEVQEEVKNITREFILDAICLKNGALSSQIDSISGKRMLMLIGEIQPMLLKLHGQFTGGSDTQPLHGATIQDMWDTAGKIGAALSKAL